MTIIAQLIGITVTLLIKQVVLICVRKQFRSAFYRKMPLKDNLYVRENATSFFIYVF